MEITVLTINNIATSLLWLDTTCGLRLQPNYDNRVYDGLENRTHAKVNLASWNLTFETGSRDSGIKSNTNSSKLHIKGQTFFIETLTI